MVTNNKTPECINEHTKKEPTKLTQNAIKFRGQIYSYLSDISNNIELFQMNVAVAKIYEMVSLISKFELTHEEDKYVLAESLRILVRVLEPMMPHLAEECWSLLGGKTSLVNVPWPEIREDYIVRDSVTIVVQINGKKRGEISLPRCK